jgi:hypothetical protein
MANRLSIVKDCQSTEVKASKGNNANKYTFFMPPSYGIGSTTRRLGDGFIEQQAI